ncbi:MAG: hypothetical protein QM736_14430 [Vicinamibacterales bacterium]
MTDHADEPRTLSHGCRRPWSSVVRRCRWTRLAAVCVGAWLMAGAAVRVDGAQGEVIDRVLAVASGEIITLSDVRAARELGRVDVAGAPDPVRAVLSQLIDRALVLAEVNRFAPPEPSAASIDAAFDAVVARFPTPAAFDATVERLGIDRTFVRELLREDLRIRAYLDQRFTAATLDEQRTMVNDWIAGLRRRADVVDRYDDTE